MKRAFPVFFLTLAGLAGSLANVGAHPGSGIVVDRDGQVFFQDALARTIWKIDAKGALSVHEDKIGGHWMALDQEGRFAAHETKLVERTPTGRGAAQLIVADGGAPVALGTDGSLFYGLATSDAGDAMVGMSKISPSGKREAFAPNLSATIADLGITGISSGPDGALYLACLSAIMRVTVDGKVSTIINPVALNDCDPIESTVFLRGLAVDANGTM